MCRFLLFKGRDPILLADLLTRPEHSIINQAFDCRLRVDQRRPLNGDGFGVGWYEWQQETARGPDRMFSMDFPAGSQTSSKTGSGASVLLSQKLSMVQEEDSETGALSKQHKVTNQSTLSFQSTTTVELDLMSVYTAKDGPCVFTSILPAYAYRTLV